MHVAHPISNRIGGSWPKREDRIVSCRRPNFLSWLSSSHLSVEPCVFEKDRTRSLSLNTSSKFVGRCAFPYKNLHWKIRACVKCSYYTWACSHIDFNCFKTRSAALCVVAVSYLSWCTIDRGKMAWNLTETLFDACVLWESFGYVSVRRVNFERSMYGSSLAMAAFEVAVRNFQTEAVQRAKNRSSSEESCSISNTPENGAR